MCVHALRPTHAHSLRCVVAKTLWAALHTLVCSKSLEEIGMPPLALLYTVLPDTVWVRDMCSGVAAYTANDVLSMVPLAWSHDIVRLLSVLSPVETIPLFST